MDLKLKGRRAVVLGGTRGIGRAIVDTLAQEGANVAFCARNPQQVEIAQDEVRALGVQAIGGVVDICDHPAILRWIKEVGSTMGGIDLLFSNASALSIGNTATAWTSNFNVDVMGAVTAFEGAKPFLVEAAKTRGDASAVFISSVSAAETNEASAYGAIKAALIHLGKGLARMHAKDNVRVNVVSPGTIYFKGGVWETIQNQMPDLYKGALARNPMGRMGSPQEIAHMAVFLSSPLSSFTTGANVIVDGGITQRVNF